MLSAARIGVFVICVTVGLSVFDIYLNFDSIPGNTYSERIREWGVRFAWLPYLVSAFLGALATHWFAKRGKKGTYNRRKKLAVTVALILALVIGALLGLLW
jgi:hypothetical protein